MLDGKREAHGPDGEIRGAPAPAGELRWGFAGAGFGLGMAGPSALDARTAALVQLGVSVAIGASPVCLQWSTARALAAGAAKDEVADVLLAIAPVAGLGRVVSATPDVAAALEYDIDAALEERDDQ